MSKATKRKHVAKEVLEDYYIPEDDEEIVKIIAGRGNNLHEVENTFGKHFLVSMPTKFRKNIWVKRGDYVVMVPIREGNKVQGEIVYILLAKQIKYLKDENLWPKEYVSAEKENLIKDESPEVTQNGDHRSDSVSDSGSDSDSTTDDELFENTNHRPMCYVDSSEEEESSADEDEIEVEDQHCKENGLHDAVTRLALK